MKRKWIVPGVIVLVGLIAGLFLYLQGKNSTVRTIEKPAFGREEQVRLIAVQQDHTEEITLKVQAKEPDETELQALFDETFSEVQKKLLENNKGPEEITNDLLLLKTGKSGVQIAYQSNDPEIVSDHGILSTEERALPVKFSLRVIMTYGEHQEVRTLFLTRVEKKEDTSLSLDVQEMIDLTDPKDTKIVLPEEIHGEAVRFEKKMLSPLVPILISVILAGSFLLLPKEHEKNRKEKREKELINAYPDLLLNLYMLLEAGMSIRMCFYKMAEEQADDSALGKEIRETVYELKNGISETEAYLNFGRRAGKAPYLRLGNLLSDNLKHGISGLSVKLKSELLDALEEKRNGIMKAGEEAGTKLTLPMVIMLVIVMVIVMTPAFLAM